MKVQLPWALRCSAAPGRGKETGGEGGGGEQARRKGKQGGGRPLLGCPTFSGCGALMDDPGGRRCCRGLLMAWPACLCSEAASLIIGDPLGP